MRIYTVFFSGLCKPIPGLVIEIVHTFYTHHKFSREPWFAAEFMVSF
jgi:hypothetical protein